MATDLTLVVSGSYFVPGSTLATGSVGPITGSQLGGSGLGTLVISGSYFTPGTTTATGSIGPITASQVGANTYPTSLVNFQQPTTGSSSGSSFTSVFYVLTGFYLAGSTRETWSGNSVNTPPPSGHSLVDIIVMGSYPPQNSAT